MDKKNNINNDFWQLNHTDEEMAKKCQELDKLNKSLIKIKQDVKDFQNLGNDGQHIICIFALNFWNKNKNIEDKNIEDKNIEEKEKQIKYMITALNRDPFKYKTKTKEEWGHKIKAQIDVVNSIEKILGAFISIDPKLFEIEKFDDVLNLTSEQYTEFYSVILAASQQAVKSIIDNYRKFLKNNKTAGSVSKMNLALSEDDLEQVEARIEKISKLGNYISLLDSMFSNNNFQELQESMKAEGQTLKDILQYGIDQCKQEKVKHEENKTMKTLYKYLISIKDNIDSVTDSFKNLQNFPEENIKNNLTEKILWNDKLDSNIYNHSGGIGQQFSETYKQFFEIQAGIDGVQKGFDKYYIFFNKESVFLKPDKLSGMIMEAFKNVISNLDCNNKETQEAFNNKYSKDNIRAAMFAVNTLHKNDNKVDTIEKTKESIDIIEALEVSKESMPKDLNNAANNIEKILLAFAQLDINEFNIKKFDDLLNLITNQPEASNLVKLQEAAIASQSAYKFIEKYQEFLDYNAGYDKKIKEIIDEFNKQSDNDRSQNKKVVNGEIQACKDSKINLALDRESFGKIKKIIDKISGFMQCIDIVYSIFRSDCFPGCQKEWNKIKVEYPRYANSDFRDFLNELLSSVSDDFDLYHDTMLRDNPKLQCVYAYIMFAKKNMFNMSLDLKKFKIDEKTIQALEKKVRDSEDKNKENRNKRIQDIHEKLAEDMFNKSHNDKIWGYTHYNLKSIEQGKEEVRQKIKSSGKNMIAGEFIEAEAENIKDRIQKNKESMERLKKQNDSTKSVEESLKKLNKKLERINKFNESKGEDGNGHVPIIFVKDKYFDDLYEKLTDENLYKEGPMSNFGDKYTNQLLTKQKLNTCYFMSILIGLIEQGMGSYIQQYIIRDYEPDKSSGKTNKAVVRLFDENGCPVDFVVDKSRPYKDDRPLWICVLEKAVSVMMNKTDFKSRKTLKGQGNQYEDGASIKKDVDWNELANKQQSKENIFQERAFSRMDIENAIESIGIQMILGKACFRKSTGKANRKIQYAKEGDETLGFISEALAQGKLVIGSTYGSGNTEIPGGEKGKETVEFVKGCGIQPEHVVFFKSIDLDNPQITTIDSLGGQQDISFTNFKRHFSDIYVTDFPKEAEILKKKEQSEKLKNEVEENIEMLNDAKNSIQNFDQTRKKIKDDIENGIQKLTLQIANNKTDQTQINDSIKSINDKIEQFAKTRNELETDIKQNSNTLSSLNNQIKKDISTVRTNAQQFNTNIQKQMKQISNQQKEIQESHENIVNDVQQQNEETNKKINSISKTLQEMSKDIQQKDYYQLLEAQKTLDGIENSIQNLKKIKTGFAQYISKNITKLNTSKNKLNTDYAEIIDSLNQQKTNLPQSIDQEISNLKKLTGEDGEDNDFKKLDKFIETNQKDKDGLAEQAKKIKEDIGEIKAKNQALKETTNKKVKEMKPELENVDSQMNSYYEQINKWKDIPHIIESAKNDLEQFKSTLDISQELKKKIDQNLLEIDNINKDFDSQIKTKINEENETRKEQIDNLNQIEIQIEQLSYVPENFEHQLNKHSETLNTEENNLDKIGEQIKLLKNNKSVFGKQIDDQIKTLENNKKDFEDQIDQQIKTLKNNKTDFENQTNGYPKTLNDEQNKLNKIGEQIQQLENNHENLKNKIENEIRKRISERQKRKALAEQYDLTSNKIKKWGIGVSVVGGVGTIAVGVGVGVGLIPGVDIVFIAVPSPFALLGIILLGICFFRNIKKPIRETTIITEPNYNEESMIQTIENMADKGKSAVEKDTSVDEQKLNNNEDIIKTNLDK